MSKPANVLRTIIGNNYPLTIINGTHFIEGYWRSSENGNDSIDCKYPYPEPTDKKSMICFYQN